MAAIVGKRVAFRISDVYLPGAIEVLRGLDERTVLLGRVIGFSDSGLQSGVFSVVQLEDGQTVIVSTENLDDFEIREISNKESTD